MSRWVRGVARTGGLAVALALLAACAPGGRGDDAAPDRRDNRCVRAFDGLCDEPGIGTGTCPMGSDTADCAPGGELRGRDDSCPLAFNDTCDEPGIGSGQCPASTDTADCLGRQRPAGILDYFQGRDDRILVDAQMHPWRTIGQLVDEDASGFCSAVLVGPDLILTAGHCLAGRDTARFQAGRDGERYGGQARLVDIFVNPAFTDDFAQLGQGNGHDWALARLDSPLGDRLGFLDVLVPTDGDLSAAARGDWYPIRQAGYSLDAGDRISAHIGCAIDEVFGDNSLIHLCDVAIGDSGSPLIVERAPGDFAVIAIDTEFLRLRYQRQSILVSLAVDARAFGPAVAAALAGRPLGPGLLVPGG